MTDSSSGPSPRGVRRSTVRRYVGFGRGLITEMGPRVTLNEYYKWVEAAEKRLTRNRQPAELLQRYAKPTGIPPDPSPRNVLLDLEEARLMYTALDLDGSETGQSIELEDACADCAISPLGQPREFEVKGHGSTFKGTIAFDRIARRYVIESSDLAQRFHSRVDGRPGMDLVTFLNRKQAFVVLPETQNILYTEGAFFSPDIAIGANFDPGRFQVGKIIEVKQRLGRIFSEKGNRTTLKATRSGWHASSVFGWLDANKNALFDSPSLFICDDMDKESADFIALDRGEKRVVLVHCKARKERGLYSASALHEICGQALKNCGTLNLFNPVKPPNSKRWHEPWKSGWVSGAVKNRVRLGGGGPKGSGYGDRLWSRLESRIRDPNVEREVWLVLGATLSRNALEAELRKPDPKPESIQTTFLLQSTMASVGGANARLRILCSP